MEVPEERKEGKERQNYKSISMDTKDDFIKENRFVTLERKRYPKMKRAVRC